MAQLPMAVGAVATGVNVVFHPAPALFQKLLKDLQSLLPTAVIVELPAIIELLPGIQLLSRRQLGLVNAQVSVWVGGVDLAVGDGKIRVLDLSGWGDSLVDCPRPDHARPVFDEPLPIVGKSNVAALVKAGVIGGHDH